MKFFKHVVAGPAVHLYPLVCWHLGAKQSCTRLIEEVVRRIKDDPLARWIYLGDAGECVTRSSKGNVYEQLVNPGDQMRLAAEYLTPVRAKGLFGLRGNHGNRIDKESGVGWDELLCHRIGVPYLGVSAFGQVVLNARPKPATFDLYAHHGAAGSVSAGGKVAAALRPVDFVRADLVLTAHTHACLEAPARHFVEVRPKGSGLRWRTTRCFACGSAYDSRSGYAEEKQYTPILPEHLVIKARVARSQAHGTDLVGVTFTHEKVGAFSAAYVSEEENAKWQS